jgi:hypothetical protein
MQWHEFIFSEKRQMRLLRHILFWIAWGMYFLLCDYVFQVPNHSRYVYGQTKTGFVILGTAGLLKVLILICLYASACYVFIYILLPQLIKSQWWKAITNILLLCSVLFVSAWLMYWKLFPFIDSLYGPYKVNDYFARFWPAVYLGLINAGKVLAVAAIIKYVKYWWLKQKEKQELERAKLNTELQLLKAQIRPGFLFNSLNNIRDYSIIASPQAPASLLKLSDLLSYMLYECDKPLVPLDKEIAMMKYYMELEKTSPGRSFEMGINIRGKLDDKLIAPFLLLPFIENSLKQSSALNGNAWIIMDIGMEENWFFMKLANGIVAGTNGSAEQETNDLNNVQKRLTLIYPQHELRIYPEQEMLITHLKIHLTDTTSTVKEENEEPVLEEQD